MAEEGEPLLNPTHNKPSTLASATALLVSGLYGYNTGLVIMRSVTYALPLPTETANNLFLIFSCSAIGSVGIMNLNKDHMLETLEALAQDNDIWIRKIWRRISGSDKLSKGTSAFNILLKIVGAAAESVIAFETVKQLLTTAPESVQTGIGALLASAAIVGFFFVEGGALTNALAGKIQIKTLYDKYEGTLQTNLFNRIFYPENAMIFCANQAKQQHRIERWSTEDDLSKPSFLKQVLVNLITLTSSGSIGLLAYLDSLSFLETYLDEPYCSIVSGLIGALYMTVDTALHSISTKHLLYGIPSEHETSNTNAMKHAPFTTIFAMLQAVLISFIPYMVFLSFYCYAEKHTLTENNPGAPLPITISATTVATFKLAPSMAVEAFGLIHALSHQEGHPLFASLMDVMQFTLPGVSISLFELYRHDFSTDSVLEAYGVASIANLAISLVRYHALKIADPKHERHFKSNKHIAGWAIANFIMPMVGGLVQALLQYSLSPKFVSDSEKASEIATIVGFVIAGLCAVLFRHATSKCKLFYNKEEKAVHEYLQSRSGISDCFFNAVKTLTCCAKPKKVAVALMPGNSTQP